MSVESKIGLPTIALIVLVVMGSALVTSVTSTGTAQTPSPSSEWQQGSVVYYYPYYSYYSYYPNYRYYRYYSYYSYYPSYSYYSYYPSTYSYYSYSPYPPYYSQYFSYYTYPYYSYHPYYRYDTSFVGKHWLTAVTNGHGFTSPSTGTHQYSAGTSVTVTAYPSYGESLVKWTIDGVDHAPSASVTVPMNADHTVAAYFTGGP